MTTALKGKAFDTAYGLYNRDAISSSDYETIRDGLEEIEPLQDRDAALEEMWQQFADTPMDPETECMEDPFLGFPAGTHRDDIWRWFDQRHSKGVAYLLYGGTEDYVPESRRLYGLKKLCAECDSDSCVFNPKGMCLVPFITGRAPTVHDDGCGDYCYKEVR